MGNIVGGSIIGVISQGQLIFGRMVFEDREKITLKDPRVFVQESAPDGQGITNTLRSYIGFPQTVDLNRINISVFYHPTEQKLINAYAEATSGIKIAKTVPFNLKVVPGEGKLN